MRSPLTLGTAGLLLSPAWVRMDLLAWPLLVLVTAVCPQCYGSPQLRSLSPDYSLGGWDVEGAGPLGSGGALPPQRPTEASVPGEDPSPPGPSNPGLRRGPTEGSHRIGLIGSRLTVSPLGGQCRPGRGWSPVSQEARVPDQPSQWLRFLAEEGPVTQWRGPAAQVSTWMGPKPGGAGAGKGGCPTPQR